MTLSEKAAHFHSLHDASNPLVLVNCWDVGSAQAVEKSGARALATGSHSVAAAHGYPDGEKIPLETVMWIAQRITRSSKLPVSVDFEGAYAVNPSDVTANVTRLIEAGAVGMNLEDGRIHQAGLFGVEEQRRRIEAARRAATDRGIPFFINARTDVFLNADPDDHSSILVDALPRMQAYVAAGADGIFVPGLTSEGLVRSLCAAVEVPINVMVRSMDALGAARAWPVARISFGPFPHAWAMDALGESAIQAYSVAAGGIE